MSTPSRSSTPASAARELPPDRSHLVTEARHEGSRAFDLLSVHEQVRVMLEDHERVTRAVAAAAPVLAALATDVTEALRRGGRLFYLGAGTSGRLGVLDASECPPTFGSDPQQVIGMIAGGDGALRRSAEGREDDPDGAVAELDAHALSAGDVVVGIAAGGTTPYVLGALKYARQRGARTAFVTCASPADGAFTGDHLVFLDTGPEILTGSTRLKAGSATKLALNILTTTAFTGLGNVYGNLMVDVRATNDKLRDRAIRILRSIDDTLDRKQAAAVLDAAGGDVKLAIVMNATGTTVTNAKERLEAANGSLRTVLSR